MAGRTADVGHLPVVEPVGEFAGDVARAVVRQQAWLVKDMGLVAA